MSDSDSELPSGSPQDRYDEARRRYGEASSEALGALSAVALDLKERRQFDAAVKVFARLIVQSRDRLDVGNGEALLAVLRQGVCLREMGQYENARRVFLKGVEISIKFYGLGSDEAITFASNLVGILDRLKEYDKVPAWAAVVDARLAQKGEDNTGVRNHLIFIAETFRSIGEVAFAERIDARLRGGNAE
jgi:tetratricopeptide (TPR) repeat protein